jgi:hypothetical protein
MKTLIWILFAIGLAVWSFMAWLAHTVIGFGGNIASGNADVFGLPPEAVEFVSWFAQFGAGVGEWLVIVVWALGAAIMWFTAYLLTRLLPGASRLTNEVGNVRNVRY